MTLPTLAITGSTGVLGGLVAQSLSDLPLRLLVRDPSRAPSVGVAVRSSYSDPGDSLDGVETLFMVSAAEDAQRLDQHRAFVDAAQDAGVKHIVYTSFFGAAPDATFTLARDHFHTERYIEATGIDHTFLRDNLYLDFMDALTGEDGVIRGPAGQGRVAAVTRADIARVAQTVLRDSSSHLNVTYELTGPEALSLDEVAAILSDVRRTSVTFHNETLAEAYESRAKWGEPDWQVDAWVSTYTAIASGELARVTDDVARVTGVPSQSLREYLGA